MFNKIFGYTVLVLINKLLKFKKQNTIKNTNQINDLGIDQLVYRKRCHEQLITFIKYDDILSFL